MEDLRVKIVDKAQEFKRISRVSVPLIQDIDSSSLDIKKIEKLSENPEFIKSQEKSSELVRELFELLDELEVKEGTVLK